MNDNTLSQLKDIHFPLNHTSFFPLANGWYILIVIIFLSVMFICYFNSKIKKRKAKIIESVSILNKIEKDYYEFFNEDVISKVSILLKRVAITKFPDEKAHLLYGDAWIKFLDLKSNSNDFTIGVGKILANSYQQQKLQYPKEFFRLIRKWIKTVL